MEIRISVMVLYVTNILLITLDKKIIILLFSILFEKFHYEKASNPHIRNTKIKCDFFLFNLIMEHVDCHLIYLAEAILTSAHSIHLDGNK